MSGNIILIKSSKIIDRLRVLNPNVEEIIECILKKVGVQSQNVYVMLENASISSIASHNLRYTNSIFVIDIEKIERTENLYVLIVCRVISQKKKMRFIYDMEHFSIYVESAYQQSGLFPVH